GERPPQGAHPPREGPRRRPPREGRGRRDEGAGRPRHGEGPRRLRRARKGAPRRPLAPPHLPRHAIREVGATLVVAPVPEPVEGPVPEPVEGAEGTSTTA